MRVDGVGWNGGMGLSRLCCSRRQREATDNAVVVGFLAALSTIAVPVGRKGMRCTVAPSGSLSRPINDQVVSGWMSGGWNGLRNR